MYFSIETQNMYMFDMILCFYCSFHTNFVKGFLAITFLLLVFFELKLS